MQLSGVAHSAQFSQTCNYLSCIAALCHFILCAFLLFLPPVTPPPARQLPKSSPAFFSTSCTTLVGSYLKLHPILTVDPGLLDGIIMRGCSKLGFCGCRVFVQLPAPGCSICFLHCFLPLQLDSSFFLPHEFHSPSPTLLSLLPYLQLKNPDMPPATDLSCQRCSTTHNPHLFKYYSIYTPLRDMPALCCMLPGVRRASSLRSTSSLSGNQTPFLRDIQHP